MTREQIIRPVTVLFQARDTLASWLTLGMILLAPRAAPAQLIYSDAFNYPNGTVVGAPGSPWVNNYFQTNIASVVNGRLFLSQNFEEGIRVNFPTYYDTGSLYVRFHATFTELPTGDGNYFACFRQSNVDNNRGRIHVATNGAAPGKFRLGVSAYAQSGFMMPHDFELGTTYSLVLRYNLTNRDSTLWVNPRSEADFTRRVDETNTAPNTGPTEHFVFVQTSKLFSGYGMGSLYVDDLRIGRSFYDVWDGPAIKSLAAAPNGHVTLLAAGIPNTNYLFQATTNLTSSNWTILSTNQAAGDGGLVFTDTNAPAYRMRFYRLVTQ